MTADGTPDYQDVVKAQARIAGIVTATPVLRSRTADASCNAHLFFKAENFQHTGSFKFRGAVNAIAGLDDQARARGVIAFSSGNHAQAVARAAAIAGTSSCIVMPADAPAGKLAATRSYGAEIVLYDRFTEDREAIARGIAQQRGLNLIPPFDHLAIIAGQGTAAAELFDAVGPLDLLLVCLGGGGLLSGSALAAATLSPRCRVIGVEPAAGNDGQRSLRAGHRVRIAVPASIADGALTTQLGAIPFAVIQRLVTDIVTVPDVALVEAMRFFAERMKIVVEPTGCLAAAAAFTGAVDVQGQRVGIILSGGNVSLRLPDLNA
jgi:threonine dehydratase